jgi:hypothetical protein
VRERNAATARTRTTYALTTVVPVVFPNSILVIKSFKGARPEGTLGAYDTGAVPGKR